MIQKPVILQLYARAPAPRRDYYGLTIKYSEVVLNVWNITHGPHVYPKQLKCPLEDLPEYFYLQEEIRHNFGGHVLTFIINLAKSERNLQYLPMKLFLCILKYLAANDILRLSQTSKIFFEICNTDNVWEILFKKRVHPLACQDWLKVDELNWKNALQQNISKQISKLDKSAPEAKKTIKNSGPIHQTSHVKNVPLRTNSIVVTPDKKNKNNNNAGVLSVSNCLPTITCSINANSKLTSNILENKDKNNVNSQLQSQKLIMKTDITSKGKGKTHASSK